MKVSREIDHRELYHLTGHQGYYLAMKRNALRAYRHNHVSTTFNPNMNGVYGHHNTDFKFVLDAHRLVETYGCYEYDHKIRVGDSHYESLNESEIRIATDSIEPLDIFHIGTIYLAPLFSRRTIQNMLYTKTGKGLFDPVSFEASNQAIQYVIEQLDGGKPFWVGQKGKAPTALERKFLYHIHDIYISGGDFEKAMRDLCHSYNIVDFDKNILDRTNVIRQQMTSKIMALVNKELGEKRYNEVSSKKSKEVFEKVIDALNLGSNAKAVLLHAAQEHHMFHPIVAPVTWTSVYRELVKGDIDEALETMKFFDQDMASMRTWFDTRPDDFNHSYHSQSRMA